MNGVHDMGGMHGFGPVRREADEPVFHHDWEPGILGAIIAAISTQTITVDEFRAERERTAPATYLRLAYYELFVGTLERLLVRKGLATEDDLHHRRALFRENPEAALEDAFTGAPHPPLPRDTQWDFRRPMETEPRFRPGDAVVTHNRQPRGHTRLARYARGKRGAVQTYHGGHVFPDSNARGAGESPGHLYSVRFEAGEIWGESADPRGAIYLDLWEDYLLPA